jgi:Domain of unknown function (DUF4386)
MIDGNHTLTSSSTTPETAVAGNLRVTGGILVAASVLALAGNLLHPRWSDDTVTQYRQMGASTLLPVADVILLVAFLLLTAGLVALVDDLRTHRQVLKFARLGASVGGTIAIIQTGVELYAFRQAAREFRAAPKTNNAYSFWSTNAIDGMSSALFATWTVVLLGLVPLLIAGGVWTARSLPRWLGVVGIVGGVLCVGVGLFDLLHQDQGDANIPFVIGSVLVTVWIFGCGWVQFARRSLSLSSTTPAPRRQA